MASKKKDQPAKEFTERARKIVAEIAAKRDELRVLMEELSDVVESLDEAEQAWEHALDKMSELL